MNKENTKSDTIQSVDRAFLVLETLSRLGSLSLNDLHKELKLNKASLSRLTHTLVTNGYIEKNPLNGNFSLTLKSYEVGISAIQNLDQINLVNSILVDLHKETGLIAQFSVEDKNELICLQSIGQKNSAFSVYTNVGKRSPLYCTSAGKALLATYSNSDVIEKWEQFNVKPFTEHTHINVQSLLQDIGEIRQNNYALDMEENEYGVFCMGTVVMKHTRTPLGAISISGTSMTKDEEERLSSLLLSYSQRLSGLLGYVSHSELSR